MQTEYRVHDVFISYRRREADGREQGTQIARALYRYLSEKGLRVFLDEERMENGPFPDQLEWQVRHAPNYIFIATENAMRFRAAPAQDYVQKEVSLALALYEEQPGDRVLLPVIPFGCPAPGEADENYPPEIRRLFRHHAPTPLDGDEPSETRLKEILERVTAVNRGNLWNAGSRWFTQAEENTGGRFAGLNIDRRILPLAGEQPPESTQFPLLAHGDESGDAPLMDMIRATAPNHLYLIGEGGIGKTTALYSIMKYVYGPGEDGRDIERNRLNGQVPLFIELSRAPDTYGRLYEGGRSTFIHRAVYQQIRTDLRVKQIARARVEDLDEVFNLAPETAVKPVHDLFTGNSPAPEYLLLLDGLNEVSRTRIRHERTVGGVTETDVDDPVYAMVLQEIRELMTSCPNVRVILTSRSREMASWDDRIKLLWLSGVKPETAEAFLRSRGMADAGIEAVRRNEKLREVLRIPLFLVLYASLEGAGEISTRGEILHLFFHRKTEKLYTARARAEEVERDVDRAASAKQYHRLTAEMQRFILDFILPEIAWRMARAGEFSIAREFWRDGDDGMDEAIESVLTDESTAAVCGRFGCRAFEEYRSAADAERDTAAVAQEMIQRLGGSVKKAVPQIINCAAMTMGILYGDGSGYSFIHQHIRDYFAAMYQVNRLRMAVFLQEHSRNSEARRCLADWEAHPLGLEIRQFAGEALGEPRNVPVCDDKYIWHDAVPEEPCSRNLIRRALDVYRGRFGREDGYAVWNLLQILKDVRGDLSGEDLSGLDLTGCEANGYTLGRRGCAARLEGARLHESFFIQSVNGEGVSGASFSPDGRRILTVSAHDAQVRDAETGCMTGILEGHKYAVRSAFYSRDGRRIAMSLNDGTARVWDAETSRPIAVMEGHSGPVLHVSFNTDGSRIVTASEDGTARTWDAETGRQLIVLEGHDGSVLSAFYSRDGSRIMTAGDDQTVRIWDAETGQPVSVYEDEKPEQYVISGPKDHETEVPESRILLIVPSHSRAGAVRVDFTRMDQESRHAFAEAWDTGAGGPVILAQKNNERVLSFSSSPDRRRILAASEDGTVIVRDAKSGRLISTLNEADRISEAAFSPDGSRIATVSGYGNRESIVKIWDAGTGRPLFALNYSSYYPGSPKILLGPEGRRILAMSYRSKTLLWDGITGQQIAEMPYVDNWLVSVSFSGNGQKLVTLSDESVRILNVADGRVSAVPEGPAEELASAAFSSDGKRIVSSSRNASAKMWDACTGQMKVTKKEPGNWDNIVVFSPDGGRYAIAAGTAEFSVAEVWDMKSGTRLNVLGEFDREAARVKIIDVSFSEDSRRIVTALDNGTAKIWEAATGQLAATEENVRADAAWQPHDWFIGISYNPDKTRFVTSRPVGGGSVIRDATIRDGDPGQVIARLPEEGDEITSAVFSRDGSRIVTSMTSLDTRILDAETFRTTGVLKGHTGEIRAAAFSPDGRLCVTSTKRKQTACVEIRDTDTDQVASMLEDPSGSVDDGRVSHLFFSRDGRKILTVLTTRFKIWDAETGRPIAKQEKYMKLISRAAFSDDGRKVLTVSENGPQVWDAETCRLISEPEVDHRSICAAAFSPDGRRLLLGCENRAEILDADTGARLAVLEGHTSAVTSAAFSPDGSRAATASDDGTVRIWDTETRTCLSVFHNVPGLDIVGVDLRRLHPESVLSDRARMFLYEYGAEVNREAGAGAQ